MYYFDLTDYERSCRTLTDEVKKNGVIENPDGSISVFVNTNGTLTPVTLTKMCCEVLSTKSKSNYYFDLDSQTCRWGPLKSISCETPEPFKVVLNPKGNDGSIFYYENNENCILNVKFDYLFKLDCEALSMGLNQKSSPNNPTNKVNQELNEKYENEKATYDELQNELEYLISLYETTRHSIICETFSSTPTTNEVVVTEKQKQPFTKTGFNGGLAPFSFPSIVEKTNVNFCISEPDGLKTWENILGSNRFNRFIVGDSTSYTCADVFEIYTQNNSSNIELIYECNTPFGSKADLLTQIEDVMLKQKTLKGELTVLNTKISEFKADSKNICDTPIGVMENLDVSMTIEVVENDGSLTQVYEESIFQQIGVGNLYNYLRLHPDNSGFYVCGEPNQNETWASGCTPLIFSDFSNSSTPDTNNIDYGNVTSCFGIEKEIINELFEESGLVNQTNGFQNFISNLSQNILSSNWLTFNTEITDVGILSFIANRKIKISFKINSSCGGFCILVDQISLDKQCKDVDSTTIVVSNSPGFNLTRTVDNKKSWVETKTHTDRDFEIFDNRGLNQIRETDYSVLDERLVINSKEIDLNVDIAKAIEFDVWKYILDNECLITGTTLCEPCFDPNDKNFQDDECFDFQDSISYDYMDVFTGYTNANTACCGDNQINFAGLLTTDLSTITTIDNFHNVLLSELIDVKNRQTISSYATLKALYERYLHSLDWCGNKSSAFTYYTMDQFANLVGDYWSDLIEQVIPATTVWGKVKIYTNTVFDQQKYKYKEYTSLLCENTFIDTNVLSPVSTCGCQDVEIISSVITNGGKASFPSSNVYNRCGKICIAQMNSGSEFIGSVITSSYYE
jgi:hypothetical protein